MNNISKKILCFCLVLSAIGFGSPSLAEEKVLILDHLMTDPLLYQGFFRHFSERDFQVEYRRYFPSLVRSDKDYSMIVIAAGNYPATSPSRITLAEKEFLKDYVMNGGILVVLFASEENDRVVFNQLLDSLSIPVRIEGKYIHDMVNGYKSTLIPSSYLLNLPMLRVHPETPLGNGVSKVYGGRAMSLIVGKGDNISIPVSSFETSLRFDGMSEKADARHIEGVYLAGPYSHAIMAVAKSGKGYVMLLPRSLINMNGYTRRPSDKPVIPTSFLAENEKFEENLIDYVARLTRAQELFKPFNPIVRWDNMSSFSVKPEKIELLAGEVPATSPADVFDRLLFDFSRKQQVRIDNDTFRRLHEQKLRIAFIQNLCGVSTNPAYLEGIAWSLKEMGFNLIVGMIQDCAYDILKDPPETKALIEDLRAAMIIFKKHNIAVMAGSGLPEKKFYERRAYPPVVSTEGVSNGPPSPFDTESWNVGVLPLAREIATLSKEFPDTLLGTFWDLELYGFNTLTFSEAYTFDGLAFGEFLSRRATNLRKRGLFETARMISQQDRFMWLKDNGLLKDYFTALEEGMEEIGKQIDAEVRAINPRLVWGFYSPAIPQSWYYKGFFRGLSSPGKPLLLISYEARGLQQVEYHAQNDVYMIHFPGMLLNTLKGGEWTKSLAGLAKREGGYWLFPGASLVMDENWRYSTGDWNILDPPEGLFQAIKEANKMIDEMNSGDEKIRPH
jgi:hypothetical protein